MSLSNDLRAFMIIPILFETFLEMWLICSAQVSLLSINTPRNFALETSLISLPFICMLEYSWFFPLGLNNIKLVLSTLRDSLLAFSQFSTLVSSVFIIFVSWVKFRELWNKVVSSANRIAVKKFDTDERSLIKIKNKSGPNIDPWGTPHFIGFNLEAVLS